MARLARIVFGLVWVGLLGACASRDTVNAEDVNETTFYREFQVRYDAQTSKLSVFAETRVGGYSGTTVRFKTPSSFKLDGEPMRVCESLKDGNCGSLYRLDAGTYYYLEKTVAKPRASYTITLPNSDGTETHLRVPLATPPQLSQEVPRAWTGLPNAPEDGETETVILSGWSKSDQTYSMNRSDAAVPQKADQSFSLADQWKAEDLETAESVNIRFTRVREGTPRLDGKPMENSRFRSTYSTQPQTIPAK